MSTEWIALVAVLVAGLALDFAFSKKSGAKSAALWSVFWVGLGLAFGGWIALRLGAGRALAVVLRRQGDARLRRGQDPFR